MKFDKNLVNGIGTGIILGLFSGVMTALLFCSVPFAITLTLIIITLFLLIGTPIINSYYPIYAPCLLGFYIVFNILLSFLLKK